MNKIISLKKRKLWLCLLVLSIFSMVYITDVEAWGNCPPCLGCCYESNINCGYWAERQYGYVRICNWGCWDAYVGFWEEDCNTPVDDNCNGQINENCARWRCPNPDTLVAWENPANPANPVIQPIASSGGTETSGGGTCSDGIDNDGDYLPDHLDYSDCCNNDGDTHQDCCAYLGKSWLNNNFCCGDDPGEYYTYVGVGMPRCCPSLGNCVDFSNTCRSGTEVCNGFDDDCDGVPDDGVTTTYYQDADRDGYGNPSVITQACSVPSGYVANNNDCDDGRANVWPGAPEFCDGLDNNCRDGIDENVKTTFYQDADRDGYGNPSVTIQACSVPSGYVTNNNDCNDNNANVRPGATEVCHDGIDNDCNPATSDTDGSCNCQSSSCISSGYNSCISDSWCGKQNTLGLKPDGSCGDYGDYRFLCYDGRFYECSTLSVWGFATSAANNQLVGSLCCDEANQNWFNLKTFYQDLDRDGYGNPSVTTQACSAPGGYVTNNNDCDDDNANVKPGAPETCDTLDNDCNSATGDGSGESWHNQATSCGIGVCVNAGKYVCTNGQKIDTCRPKPTSPEICDGLDNDCDTNVDEPNELTPPLNDNQKGVCAGSKKICAHLNGWVNSYSSVIGYEANTEVTCHDSLDNDCDGVPDCGDSNCPGRTGPSNTVCCRQSNVNSNCQNIPKGNCGIYECVDYKCSTKQNPSQCPQSGACGKPLSTCSSEGTKYNCRYDSDSGLCPECNDYCAKDAASGNFNCVNLSQTQAENKACYILPDTCKQSIDKGIPSLTSTSQCTCHELFTGCNNAEKVGSIETGDEICNSELLH